MLFVLEAKFGRFAFDFERFELYNLNDYWMKITLLLKTPELEVDILSVENQSGTPVRYPDFNNYTEVLIQTKWMVWRTNWIAGAGTGDRNEL